ncbi:MAG: disulfide oxidoreductase, partial [Pseudomonadota bacterium]
LERIFIDLHQRGTIPEDWLAGQIRRIDRVDGDIDALSKRLAFIRTWTYVAQRKGWTGDENHWREATRVVEDRLSDALHDRLTQRFVDRRTSVLLRRLGQKEAMVAEVSESGEVTVEGEFVGKLDGFRFRADKGSGAAEEKAIKSAALQALAPHFHLRADRFYNAPDTEIDFTEQGGLMWGAAAVGKLVAGADPLKPQVEVFVDDVAGPDVAQKVQRRLQHFIDRKTAALFEPLIALSKDETLTGLARGFAFQLVEGFGIIPRARVAQDVKALDQDARGTLRKHGIRFGQFTIFMPLLLKPAPTRLRLVLWSLSKGLDEFPESPPPGLVTIPAEKGAPEGADTMSGYRAAGTRAIRIDMLERLADMLRSEDSRSGFEAKPDMLSITGMTLEQFADLMGGLGYTAKQDARLKAKPVAVMDTEAQSATPQGAEHASKAAEGATETDTAVPLANEPPAHAPEKSAVTEPTEASAPPGAEQTVPEDQEMEVFYTFTWGRPARQKPGPRRNNNTSTKPRGKGKPQGKARKTGAHKDDRTSKAQSFSAKPAKKDKPIDPDNPFAAALMGLKDQK